MQREILRQANFAGGELDPGSDARRDLRIYGQSLAEATNLAPRAQGPIRRRGGLAHVSQVRTRLEDVSLDAATLTAANGGTAAGAASGEGMTTTTAIGETSPYVILEVDFGAPVAVGLVDLIDFALVADSDSGWEGDGPPPAPRPPTRWDGWNNPLVVLP